MIHILKYPRTQHIESSRLQAGDEDLEQVPFKEIAGLFLVVEEKVDGANTGVSFSEEGALLLQSRGHYLNGGPREKHFDQFKSWAFTHLSELYEVLGQRYLMYGEWLYAKHTVFYDQLPHYFMEFDVFDRETQGFLSTAARRQLLAPLDFLQSVPVLHEGPLKTLAELTDLLQASLYKSPRHREVLQEYCAAQGLRSEQVLKETDPTDLSEGLYLKTEAEGFVTGRYKWVRPDFLQTMLQSGSHWHDRPIIPNQLAEGKTVF